MARPKNFTNMTLQEKYIAVWDRLPREVHVAIWVTLSGAVTALIDYLTTIEAEPLTMAVVNVVLVLLQNRRRVVTSQFD